MVQYCRTGFDASFAALADATRRGVLEQLGRGNASITDLADRFHMTLTGMKKHVGVLEQAGLVTTEKVGRVRTCRLGARALQQEAAAEMDRIVKALRKRDAQAAQAAAEAHVRRVAAIAGALLGQASS